MKQNKINIILAAIAMLTFVGCSSDFLDKDNIYNKDLAAFYNTEDEIDAAVAGLYEAMYSDDIESIELLICNIFDDVHLGGGGTENANSKAFDRFTYYAYDAHFEIWDQAYRGIFRANYLVEGIFASDLYKDPDMTEYIAQALGEAYFMRAFYHFRLAKLFGGIPVMSSTSTDITKSRDSYTDTFKQILSDLVLAVKTFPDKGADEYTLSEYGHANKWSAIGYIARAFLQYTGYMTNIMKTTTTSIELNDGTTLTKAMVVSYLEDCINDSGYELTPDFRNLWPYAYVNTSAATQSQNKVPYYEWADTEGLAWVGQDGFYPTVGTGNKEVMFCLRYAQNNANYTNRSCIAMTGRNCGSTYPVFNTGWGMAPIHRGMYNEWDDADQRKKGSVIDYLDQTAEDSANPTTYTNTTAVDCTYLYTKKYGSYFHNGSMGTINMFSYITGIAQSSKALGFSQDVWFLRLADVYLMHSELSETATYMNKVRNRAGLASLSTYSLDALKKERMYELMSEGLRWFDLVRWGDINVPANTYYGETISTSYAGLTGAASKDDTSSAYSETYSVTYPTAQLGLIPIPDSQVSLANGAYTQNPGWGL